METQTILILILIGLGIVSGSFCSFLAKEKNRDSGTWFICGFLFSFIALVAIAGLPVSKKNIMKKAKEKVLSPNITTVEEKPMEFACSECGANIIRGEKNCSYCGVEIDWNEI